MSRQLITLSQSVGLMHHCVCVGLTQAYGCGPLVLPKQAPVFCCLPSAIVFYCQPDNHSMMAEEDWPDDWMGDGRWTEWRWGMDNGVPKGGGKGKSSEPPGRPPIDRMQFQTKCDDKWRDMDEESNTALIEHICFLGEYFRIAHQCSRHPTLFNIIICKV